MIESVYVSILGDSEHTAKRAAGGDVVSETELADRVTQLRAVPGNNECVDCGAARPQWVTANIGAFVW